MIAAGRGRRRRSTPRGRHPCWRRRRCRPCRSASPRPMTLRTAGVSPSGSRLRSMSLARDLPKDCSSQATASSSLADAGDGHGAHGAVDVGLGHEGLRGAAADGAAGEQHVPVGGTVTRVVGDGGRPRCGRHRCPATARACRHRPRGTCGWCHRVFEVGAAAVRGVRHEELAGLGALAPARRRRRDRTLAVLRRRGHVLDADAGSSCTSGSGLAAL